MAYKVTMSAHAKADLDHIAEYIAVQLCNASAASSFIDEVSHCLDVLEDTPFMYALCQDVRLAEKGYRKAIISSYIMLYTVDEDEACVRIARLFYGAENYASKV